MIQGILVSLLFGTSAFYLIRLLRREFSGKGGHCGDCPVSEVHAKDTHISG